MNAPTPDGPRHPFAGDAPSPPPTPDATGTRPVSLAGGIVRQIPKPKSGCPPTTSSPAAKRRRLKTARGMRSGAAMGWPRRGSGP